MAVMAFAVMSLATGCKTPKDVAYFQDIDETVIPVAQKNPIRIQPNDKLSIIIKSKDPVLADLFNLTVNTNRTGLPSSSSGTEGLSSYTVSREGTIDFPQMGQIKVAGMTRGELASFIKGELIGRSLVKDPVVTVELLNASYSVLGEVGRPGRYGFSKDAISILEAISQAGDLGIQGKRDNITIVRHEPDGVHSYKVDLTNIRDVVSSPAYYLQPDDIIYVEPNGVKKRQTTVNGNNLMSWGFWVSVASLLTSVAVLVVK